MNNLEFKFAVEAPYQPVEFGRYHWVAPAVATTVTAIELARTYYSVLMWRGHSDAMAKSKRHAAVLMGEVDEPDETKSTYNPLFSAGFLALGLVFDTANKIRDDNDDFVVLSKHEQLGMTGPIIQLLFALAQDDDALAQHARHQRTGYLGHPSTADRERVDEYRKFVRSVVRHSDQIEAAFKRANYDLPLQTPYCYDPEARCYYWSDPILIPESRRVEDDE